MPAAWSKRCCYCHDVIEEPLEEAAPGNPPQAHTGLWLLPSSQAAERVSHGICGLCFQARMAVLKEEAGTLPAAATLHDLRRSS
ncbi:MAG: hypothetical protein HYZ11_14550 [Candidatus Tectomicrobia bacterium]|uniref:Uncharacterized protein n=1 Tax=Tectimicrobiota bacterium TaxID=2528274 RepID=A0A932I2Z6_UNCTE|nr:hypothetical protein [Candidatus Tectomicrobia bacterium]